MAAAAVGPLKLGEYVVGDTLGEGGFSKVKLGTHESSGKKVALKLLQKKSLGKDSSEMKQVQREIDALSKLDHPNIIKLHSVDWACKYPDKDGKLKDMLLLVIELAEGGELFDFLSFTGAFSEAVARTYFHQLISALKDCHSKGIAHRDLKPENLLLDAAFQLKVADFGFAHMRSGPGAHVMHTECGTKGYMAPEILSGKTYDESADVFSAGVILFIMLAGFPPFQFATKQDWWFDKLMTGKHSMFWKAHCRSAYFSEPVKDFINKILSPDSAKRMNLREVETHEWFRGPVLSPEELKEEMSSRKQTVLKEKRKEKEAKAKNRKGEAREDSDVDRRIALGDDDLPASAPAMAYGKGAFVKAGDDDDDTDELTKGVSFKPKSSAPIFDEKEEAGVYTVFTVTCSPIEAMDKLQDVLHTGKIKHSVDAASWKIKAKYLDAVSGNAVQFVVRVFQGGDAGKAIIEFRRRKGNTLLFHGMYDEMMAQLGEVLYVPADAE